MVVLVEGVVSYVRRTPAGPAIEKGGCLRCPGCVRVPGVTTYLTESVYKIVLQKSIPPEIRQFLLYYY